MNFENLRVKTIRGVLRYRPNITRWTASRRKEHIIGIQLTGSALHTMDNQSFTISTGCIYFLNKKDDYSVQVYEPCDALSIHFTTYEDIENDSFCLPFQNSYEIISLLQKAEALKSAGNELKLLSVFYEICGIFETARVKPYAQSDVRMLLAKNYIDSHFTEDGCIKAVVAESKLCARRFRDLFSQMFNVTPNKYVTLKRIELAQNLLSAGGISVTEVAERTGFSDIYYFSKVFKQISGKTPTSW